MVGQIAGAAVGLAGIPAGLRDPVAGLQAVGSVASALARLVAHEHEVPPDPAPAGTP